MLDLDGENIFHCDDFPTHFGGGVNKADLIDHVASAAETSKKEAEAAVEAVLAGIVDAIKKGEDVSLFGFGKFSPKANAARTGRNPQTGDSIQIAASTSVKFGAAAGFKAALNVKPVKKAAAKKAAPAAKAAKAPTPAPAKKVATPKKAAAKKAKK